MPPLLWKLLRVIIPLNMSVFEKEKHCIFWGTMFYMYVFLGYQIGLKSVFL